ncbi:MAG: hypothetical protein U9O54_03390 [Chloroflexota bacterium]|nr:hypothetical protein [Chloroflexota bacterium]
MTKILFVCTANICRSPMAEGLFRQQVRNMDSPHRWRMASAGTWTKGGYPADKVVLKLLAEIGIDMRGHRSREVSERLLMVSDVVLVMEASHKEALRAEFPDHAAKIFLLSELAGKTQDVIDPVGGPLVDYRATLTEIKSYLKNAPAKIMELSNSAA